ncbi:uncharacterized protein [Anabrus simplex]|uniref:uncharacterized protein n=1 Tax=Anabrus simplex TaxID=316456 RepID=UPI0035A313EF
MLFKMDFEVKIKEEPICFEETSNTSCDNYNFISEEMHLKGEPKSELAVPRETQPSSNIKNEISVDEHTVGQLVACFKEEDKWKNNFKNLPGIFLIFQGLLISRWMTMFSRTQFAFHAQNIF